MGSDAKMVERDQIQTLPNHHSNSVTEQIQDLSDNLKSKTVSERQNYFDTINSGMRPQSSYKLHAFKITGDAVPGTPSASGERTTAAPAESKGAEAAKKSESKFERHKNDDGSETTRVPNDKGGYDESTYDKDGKLRSEKSQDKHGDYTERTYDARGNVITKTKHEQHLGKGSDHVVTDGQGNTITARHTYANGDWIENGYNEDHTPGYLKKHKGDGHGGYTETRVSGSGSQVGGSVEVTIVNGDGVTKQTVDEKGHVLEIGANGKVSEYNVWDEGHNRVTPQRPLGEDEPE